MMSVCFLLNAIGFLEGHRLFAANVTKQPIIFAARDSHVWVRHPLIRAFAAAPTQPALWVVEHAAFLGLVVNDNRAERSVHRCILSRCCPCRTLAAVDDRLSPPLGTGQIAQAAWVCEEAVTILPSGFDHFGCREHGGGPRLEPLSAVDANIGTSCVSS